MTTIGPLDGRAGGSGQDADPAMTTATRDRASGETFSCAAPDLLDGHREDMATRVERHHLPTGSQA